MPKQLKFDNFTGGLNLNESTTIKDNELAKAQNVFYDNDNRLTSRRGIKNFGNAISSTITQIASMDTFNGDGTWTAGGDAGTVATDATNKKVASGSTTFEVTVTGTSASVINTGITAVDITANKEEGYFTFWMFLDVVTDFTSVTLTLGDTVDTDDYELALTTNAAGSALATGWNYMKVTWSDMTSAGSPTGSIDEVRFTCTYAVGYAGGTVKFDALEWHSDEVTKGVHSLYNTQLADDTRVTMAGCGGNVLRLLGEEWYRIASGYTDGERFSFLNYKSVIYFSNGTDNFSYFTIANEAAAAAVVVEDASAPKAKYLMMVANTAYAAGVSGSLNLLEYSNALPANLLAAVWANSESIYDDDSREVITGISKLPSDAIAVYLEKSAYYVDTVPSTTVIRPMDYDGGCVDFRTIQRVGNDTFFMAQDAVYSLSQRQGASGTFGAQALSDNVQSLITVATNLTKSNAFRGKHVLPNHYYLNIDTSNTGDPDTCLVYNIKLGAWTQYSNISANQIIEYEDSDGFWHLIYANVYSGQVREMEVGFNDNSTEIQVAVWTKENDFGDPTLFKEIREMDVSGFISDTGIIEVTDELDGENSTTSTILGTSFEIASTGVTLGTSPIGFNPLTGEPIVGDFIQLNLFNVRNNIYNSAFRIQAKLESSTADSAWILSKIQFQIEALPLDFFSNDNYI